MPREFQHRLLDTHILFWWLTEPDRLSPAQRRTVGGVSADAPMLVSDVSLWELATLYHLGRIHIAPPLREWLEKAVAPPLVRRQDISPAVAAESASLPDTFHRDPADRILVATARVLGATLLTQDQRIIASGLVETLD